jgi:hypothetical protein
VALAPDVVVCAEQRLTMPTTHERREPGAVATIRSDPSLDERVTIYAVTIGGSLGRCTVTVELRRADDHAVAVTQGINAPTVTRRLVADATLQALTMLEPAAAFVAVDGVAVGPVGGQQVATATLVHVLAHSEEVFAGAAVVRPAGEPDAVVRAILDGTNRYIGRPRPA